VTTRQSVIGMATMKHTDNRPPAGIQIRRRSVNFGGTGLSGRSTCATRDIPSQRTRVSVSHSRSRSSSDRLAPSAYLLDGDRRARHQPHCFRCDAWTRRDLDVACDHHPGLHDGGPEAPRYQTWLLVRLRTPDGTSLAGRPSGSTPTPALQRSATHTTATGDASFGDAPRMRFVSRLGGWQPDPTGRFGLPPVVERRHVDPARHER
jgi:hypothetical protein